MSNDQYKVKSLVGLQPTRPAIGNLRANSVLRHAPFLGTMRAQDTVPATSRRTLASWSLAGADDWAQPNGSTDPDAGGASPQAYPTDTWRTLQDVRAHVTPGCILRGLVLYCPAGLVHKGGGPWESDGAWAEARVLATWTNGVNTDGPNAHSILMEGSQKGTYTGLENSGAGQNWSDLRRKAIYGIEPAEFTTDPTVAVAFSEWSDVRLQLQVRGGARVVAFLVYEVPRAHATLHSNSGLTSVHAIPATNGQLTPMPMTTAPDGTDYDEYRFGTLRTMQVAERQSERLGPRILHGGAWNEDTIDVLTDTEADPIAVTSASFVDIFDSSITSWAETNPGYLITGSNAQLHRWNDPTLIAAGRFAVVPVRVRIDATPAAAGTAVVRVQSGPYEWIDVTIAGGGARAIFTAIGFLRSQVFADHNVSTCQILARTSSGTLNLRNWSIDFGHWA